VDGTPIQPELTLLDTSDEVVQVAFDDFGLGSTLTRGVPARRLTLADGTTTLVATVYDLLMAQYGVPRGLPGEYPRSDDDVAPYTPAWAEQYTGVSRANLVRFAHEWGETAERTNGRCLILIGAGVNHWYHANLMYRAAIHSLMFCGCVGVNGGGLGHYVGQEKLAPMESWSSIAFARDWLPAPRLQNAPSWHYVHSDQWRYERSFTDYHTVPAGQPPGSLAAGHTMDVQVRAVRNGWLPFYPQFDRNPLDIVSAAEAAGAATPDDVVAGVVKDLTERRLRLAVEDPDAPRTGRACGSSGAATR
jgi:nitrate reductase / nitrite oxidoreductase, alpha subunit